MCDSNSSTLGILDLDKLCGDFEDTFSVKQSSLRQKLGGVLEKRLSLKPILSPPKISDLNGSIQEPKNEELDYLADQDSRSSFETFNSSRYAPFTPMESKFFRSGLTFDPTCLKNFDSTLEGSCDAMPSPIGLVNKMATDVPTREIQKSQRRQSTTVVERSSATHFSQRRRSECSEAAKLSARTQLGKCVSTGIGAFGPVTSTPYLASKPESIKESVFVDSLEASIAEVAALDLRKDLFPTTATENVPA